MKQDDWVLFSIFPDSQKKMEAETNFGSERSQQIFETHLSHLVCHDQPGGHIFSDFDMGGR